MVDTPPRVDQHIVMGVQIPLGPSEPLLRVTAAQVGTRADAGAFAGLRTIELRDRVLCQMNAPYRPRPLAKIALFNALRDILLATRPEMSSLWCSAACMRRSWPATFSFLRCE